MVGTLYFILIKSISDSWNKFGLKQFYSASELSWKLELLSTTTTRHNKEL